MALVRKIFTLIFGKHILKQEVGPVRVVYAEIDDCSIHLEQSNKWVSKSGAPCHTKMNYLVFFKLSFNSLPKISTWGVSNKLS